MNKPSITTELIVWLPPNDTLIVMYPGTTDAAIWIAQEAPAYGRIEDDSALFGFPHITLSINPLYDREEVGHYLAHGYSKDAILRDADKKVIGYHEAES